MPGSSYTVVNAMIDIVASPGRALEEIRHHGAWFWWPLLISIVLGCAAFSYYYAWVDFEWLVDQTIAAIPAKDRAGSEDAIRGFMSPTSSIVTTCLAVVIITFLIYALQAAYLHLAAKLGTRAQIRYGQWFSFSAWTAFVGVFATLTMFVVIFMADNNRLGQDELAPFSMNSLFIHAEMGDDWFNWGNSLNLTHFWMLGLMALGYSRWTGASMVKSAITVVLPWAALFGIWAAVI